MSSYIIEGGKKLEGEVEISGSKNASLPILASTILNGGKSKIYNVPQIHDIQITLEILRYLGCKVHIKNGRVEIDSSNIKKTEIPEHLMREMRSTVILAGALIGKFKKATFSYPGGCDIGARPIDLHLKAFKKLGINIEENYGFIRCVCDKIVGTNIDLDFPSVGATENIILASVLSEGETVITNSAKEPEIVDLAKALNRMGAKIYGAGTNIVKIIGVTKLEDLNYRVIPDRIEAGTFLCAAAITGGNVKVKNVISDELIPVISKLEEAGCKVETKRNEIAIKSPKTLKAVNIKTLPYPGFPTDMQSILGSVLCISRGTSIIEETIFESRFKYLSELKRMGAKVEIKGNIAIITGVKKLSGTILKVADLRGGAALVLAGLYAKGITKINDIEFILRGYEDLDKKLRKIGASINLEK